IGIVGIVSPCFNRHNIALVRRCGAFIRIISYYAAKYPVGSRVTPVESRSTSLSAEHMVSADQKSFNTGPVGQHSGVESTLWLFIEKVFVAGINNGQPR